MLPSVSETGGDGRTMPAPSCRSSDCMRCHDEADRRTRPDGLENYSFMAKNGLKCRIFLLHSVMETARGVIPKLMSETPLC